MTSKERLLNTFYRKKTDRVPISLYELCPYEGSAYASFANHAPSYQKLLRVMREKTDCIMMSNASVRYPEVEARTETQKWRTGKSVFEKTVIHTPKGDLTSLTRQDDDIYTVWHLEHLLKDEADIAKYQSLDFSYEIDHAKPQHDKAMLGDRGLIMQDVSDPICHACELFSMQDFLVLAVTETETAQAFTDWLWHRRVKNVLADTLQAEVTDHLFRIVGAEYATPPYLPDRLFDVFVTPYVKEIAAMVKKAGAIPRLHAHGRVRHALSQLIDTDIVCVDPIEPIPDGDISLKEVKRLYGDRLTLIGNIELKTLETASPSDIDELVKSVMQDAKEGGGFILMPTAAPINVPLHPKTEANLIAMIEAGLAYGRY